MTGRPLRSLALPLLLVVTVVSAGACGKDDKTSGSDGAASKTTTTTSATGDDGSTTTAPGPGATTTTAAGATTSSAPRAGGDDPGSGVIELNIVGGNVEGGVRRETVKQGAQVTLRINSDTGDEIHVHTYDLKVDLVAGQSADLTFLAKIPGVFEVELEHRGKKVLELEVKP